MVWYCGGVWYYDIVVVWYCGGGVTGRWQLEPLKAQATSKQPMYNAPQPTCHLLPETCCETLQHLVDEFDSCCVNTKL